MSQDDELISINEAATRGIRNLRMRRWVNPFDHLRIDIIEGRAGPWTHLYSPINVGINGRDPVDIICLHMDYNEKVYEPYTGLEHDSAEYIAARSRATPYFADLKKPKART